MIYKLGLPQFGRFINFPCSAVDNYMKLASGDFYKVLLAALCSDNGMADTAELAERCAVTTAVAEDALLYWSSCGVISAEPVGGAHAKAAPPVSASAPASVPEPAAEQLPVSTVEAVRPTKSTASRSHVRYSNKELAQKARDDENLRVLFEEIQKVFGRTINGTDTASLVDLYEYYGFDVPSILILAEYCRSIGKSRLAYMQTVAREWYESGICTYSQIEQEIVRRTAQSELDSRFCTILGIEWPPTKKQCEYFRQWSEWGFGEEMVELAGQRCRDRKNRLELPYMNGIMRKWQEKGLFSVSAVEEQEDMFRQSKAVEKDGEGPSYDVGKWQELADSIDLENLSFKGDDGE